MKKLSTESLPAKLERKLYNIIDLQKRLAEQEQDLKAELMEAMEKHNIVSIKNDMYSITRAERTSYKADVEEIDPQFTKLAMDTTKVSNYKKLYGELPENITETITPYIVWRIK